MFRSLVRKRVESKTQYETPAAKEAFESTYWPMDDKIGTERSIIQNFPGWAKTHMVLACLILGVLACLAIFGIFGILAVILGAEVAVGVMPFSGGCILWMIGFVIYILLDLDM